MTVATGSPQVYTPTDLLDLIENLLQRVQVLEQQAPQLAGGIGSSTSFPGGISVGSPPVLINTSITGLSTLVLVGSAYLGFGYIDASWTIPDTTVATVEIFYALKALTGGTYDTPRSLEVAGTGTRIEGVIPGRTYGCYVVSRNNLGIPALPYPAPVGMVPSYQDVVIPADSTVPPTLSGVATNLGADALIVTWTAVSSTELDVLDGGYYEVELDGTSNAFTHVLQDWRGPASVMSFDGLSAVANAATNYWVRVRAVSVGGIPGAWTDAAGGSPVPAGGTSGTDILARTISAVSIVAGTITSNEIHANTIVAGNIAAGTITATQLAALQLTVGQYIRSANYIATVSGWNIDEAGSAEFQNITAKGNINSSTITSSTVQSSTILASLIETAASGNRVVMSSATSSYGGTVTLMTPSIDFYSGGSGTGDSTNPAYIGGFISNTFSGLAMVAPGGSAGIARASVVIGSKFLSMFVGDGGAIDMSTLGTGGTISIGADTFTEILASNSDGLTIDNVGGATFTHGVTMSGGFDLNWSGGGGILVNTGNIVTTSGGMFATAFTVTSDVRLKKEVANIRHSDMLMSLRPVSFKWHKKGMDENRHYGLIAQELRQVFPELVTDLNDRLHVNYTELIPLLISEVQKLRMDVSNLQGAH